MSLRFEPPTPEVPREQEDLQEAAEELRANPGHWALLGKVSGKKTRAARTYAWSIRHDRDGLPGRAFDGDAHRYEVEARTVIGEQRVYIRYIPPPAEE
jgi:hypothetical protein